MTDDQKALHQIYTECIREYARADDNKTRLQQRQYRLDDIERIAGARIIETALDKVS